jgi:membrane protein DedA with SNARE-associated domain
MEALIEHIVEIVTNWGYPGIFFFMMLEACCMPIPSEAILPGAGYLVGQDKLHLWPAIAAGLGGALTGSSISYCVGRFGGKPLLVRFGRYILLTEPRLNATEAWFTRHGSKAVFFCRWISGMRAIVSIPAGLCHMPYLKFLAYTTLGSGTWVVAGVLFGMFVGREWKTLSNVGHYLLGAILVAAAVALVIHHLRQRRSHSTAAPVAQPCEKIEAGD